MKKINILKKNEDFNRIIKNNKPYKTRYFYIYLEWTNEKIYHFGLSVGKKIGNAVERNRSRRVIKEAFRSVCPNLKPEYDIVLVARSKTKYVKSTRLAEIMNDIFTKEGMFVTEGDE